LQTRSKVPFKTPFKTLPEKPLNPPTRAPTFPAQEWSIDEEMSEQESNDDDDSLMIEMNAAPNADQSCKHVSYFPWMISY
jgi:hypothetical protein